MMPRPEQSSLSSSSAGSKLVVVQLLPSVGKLIATIYKETHSKSEKKYIDIFDAPVLHTGISSCVAVSLKHEHFLQKMCDIDYTDNPPFPELILILQQSQLLVSKTCPWNHKMSTLQNKTCVNTILILVRCSLETSWMSVFKISYKNIKQKNDISSHLPTEVPD